MPGFGVEQDDLDQLGRIGLPAQVRAHAVGPLRVANRDDHRDDLGLGPPFGVPIAAGRESGWCQGGDDAIANWRDEALRGVKGIRTNPGEDRHGLDGDGSPRIGDKP